MTDTSGDDTFGNRLLPGERLRWTGRPVTGLLFTKRDWTFVPFSIVWLGLTTYICFFAVPRAAASMTSFIGILFVGIGIYLLAGRFLIDMWARNLTRYAVTDQRVLMARGSPFTKFTALNLNTIGEMGIEERADGSGTIMFGPEIIQYGRRGRRTVQASPSFDPTPQFLAIPDARVVFDMIQRETTRDR